MTKPLLLFLEFPEGAGHMRQIAAEMVHRDYEVHFMACNVDTIKDEITNFGAKFIKLPSTKEFAGGFDWDTFNRSAESSDSKLALFHQKFSIEPTKIVNQTLMKELVLIRRDEPNRQVILILDTFSQAALPFRHGSPPPAGYSSFPKTIGIHGTYMWLESMGGGQSSPALPLNSARVSLNEVVPTLVGQLQRAYLAEYFVQGATSFPDIDPLDAWITSWDVTFQLCSSSMEYYRNDIPDNVKFAGCLPAHAPSAQQIDPAEWHPKWWSEVCREARKKDLVLLVIDNKILIDQVLKATSQRTDVLIFLVLRNKKPQDVAPIRHNVRVTDEITYRYLLPHAAICITVASFQFITNSVMASVPMVLLTRTADEMKQADRAVHAGFALPVDTRTFTGQQINDQVTSVLSNPEFRHKAVELQRENEEMDALSTIERQIVDFTE